MKWPLRKAEHLREDDVLMLVGKYTHQVSALVQLQRPDN